MDTITADYHVDTITADYHVDSRLRLSVKARKHKHNMYAMGNDT